MRLINNPTSEQVSTLIKESVHKAAKWIKDHDGDIWAWPAEQAQHSVVANSIGVKIFDKGLFIENHQAGRAS